MFNTSQKTGVDFPTWLGSDSKLIERILGIGFFYYGPRLWMVGEIEPLKKLQDKVARGEIVQRVIREYPKIKTEKDSPIYRIRKNPAAPDDFSEYDSPSPQLAGVGRFNTRELPICYCSSELSVCIHECRVTIEDEIYVATLSFSKELNLLDLTASPKEQFVTEFESLALGMRLLFLAGEHSYDITRSIAFAASEAGFDGIIYPSYFSMVREGVVPYEPPQSRSEQISASPLQRRENLKSSPNLALFGHPLAENKMHVKLINRVMIRKVEYHYHFGPVII